MEIMSSPFKNALDSPSRQLLYELSRLGITAQEDFYARLDKESLEREAQHRNELAAAALAHEQVRRGAEIERARLAEIEKQRVIEARRVEAAAAEQKRQEREEKNAEIARRLKELQDAKAKDVEVEMQAKKDADEAASRAGKAKPLAASASQSSPAQRGGVPAAVQPSRNPEREAEHRRYLTIHRNLKESRKYLTLEASKSPQVKQQMGEMRRELKKCIGQLTEGKGANRGPVSPIKSFFSVLTLTNLQHSFNKSFPSSEDRHSSASRG